MTNRNWTWVGLLSLAVACQLELHGAVPTFTGQLPMVILEASTAVLTNRGHHPAKVTVLAPKDGWASFSNGIVDYCGAADVWLRGNSSRLSPKKSYRLELHNEAGDQVKKSLLGMPGESDWILLGAFPDLTLLRNNLAYELWSTMGHYAPRTRFVELFTRRGSTNQAVSTTIHYATRPTNAPLHRTNTPVAVVTTTAQPVDTAPPKHSNLVSLAEITNANKTSAQKRSFIQPVSIRPPFNPKPIVFGEYEYQGIYVLLEKVKRGRHRLDIEKLRKTDNAEPEITGGYIFKRDRLNQGERGFGSTSGVYFFFEEPKARDITPAQSEWLTNHVNEVERILFGERFTDPTNGYARFIDLDSFIDYHWMTEMSRNIDGYSVSQLYHKDRGGKIRMGPVWDFDLAFGNAYAYRSMDTNGWRWTSAVGIQYKWFARLFEDPDFLQRYIDRWAELRRSVFATSNVLARVDRLAAELKEAQARNFERWPVLESHIIGERFVGASHAEEVQWLKDWIAGRLAWIDTQDFPPPAMHVANNRLSGTNEVRLACLVGKIYCTTNGADPRAGGGQPSRDAFEYRSPVQLPQGTPFSARIRSDEGLWSAPVKWERKPANAQKDAHSEHKDERN